MRTAAVAGRFPMGQLEMSGSYPLTHEAIDALLSRTAPGNYALGYMDGAVFTVFYVGRSDSDLRVRLHEWVDAPSRYRRYGSGGRAPYGVSRRGRSPLGAPALDRVGSGVDSAYTRFAYSYASSPGAAFEKECRTFRDFGGSAGLDNESAPVPAP
jgi:hypothetical protein